MQRSPHASGHTSVLVDVLDWWHALRERHARLAEIENLGAEELARMAADVGLSSDELVRLAGEPAHMAELLDRRLAALGLSHDEIRKLSPLLLVDLQRTCSCCADKKRCAEDMAADPNAPGWEAYCPNAGTLRSLT